MSQSEEERKLLAQVNALLPPGIDWKDGARVYLEALVGSGCTTGPLSQYMYTKPFHHAGDGQRGLDEFVDLMSNFTSVVELLRLPAGSRILDVACGAGWMSHYFSKLAYRPTGIDISADMVTCAVRRHAADPTLPEGCETPEFLVCDLETEPLPERAVFHAAVFESCLHHFYNPIAALRHVAEALREDGIAILIEGENRQNGIRPEYMAEMEKFRTIERPYSREELTGMLRLAGLPCYEFFGRARGWISTRAHSSQSLWDLASQTSDLMNHTVCAKNPAAMQRVLPWWKEEKK